MTASNQELNRVTDTPAGLDYRWPFQRVAERSAQWVAVFMPIALVLPTAWLSVTEVLLLLTWALSGRYSLKWSRARSNPVVLLGTGLFVALVIGTLYSKADWSEALDTLDNYIALLFIPIIVTIFDEDVWRKRALNAFLIGVAVIALVVCMRWLELLPPLDDVRMAFKNHITEGLILAFGCFVIAHRVVGSPRRRIWWVLGLILVSTLLFFLYGAKSGYVIFFALFLLFFWQRFGWRAMIPTLVLLVALTAVLWSVSDVFRHRVEFGFKGLMEYRPGAASDSVGVRLEYYKNTWLLIKENPLLGVGTGGFPEGYREIVKEKSLPRLLITENPHNEYLLLAAQLGVGGAALLIGLLYVQWITRIRLTGEWRYIAQGVAVAMGVGCLFNSVLLDFTDGAWFGVMSGIVFSALNPRNT